MANRVLKGHSIEIAGQKVTLRTDAADTYVRRLAELVNSRFRAARDGTPTASIQNVLALVSIQLADDLAEVEERVALERREMAGEMRKLAARISDSAGALERWAQEAQSAER